MYTATMTPAEIDHETHEDVLNVLSKLNHKQNEFRRKVLKATHFPVVMRYEQNTVRKNRWKVMIKAFTKHNTMGRAAIVFYCISESAKGKFVYLVLPFLERGRGKYQTIVYKPHYFSRYRERMGLDLEGEELIDHVLNIALVAAMDYMWLPDGRVTVIQTCGEGFSFGESYDTNNVIVLRTYVPKKMLFKDQSLLLAKKNELREVAEEKHLEDLKTLSAQQWKDEAFKRSPGTRDLLGIPKNPPEFKKWMERVREIAPEIEKPDE